MRVKIAANPPLPLVRAWFPLPHSSAHGQTISTLKSLLCTSLPAFHGRTPSSLRLSIDGFELLDHSELTVVRDGDLISVDVCDVPFASSQTADQSTAQSRLEAKPLAAAVSRKRKRPPSPSTPSSGSESDIESTSSSESESESESSSETSDSGSGSESDVSSVSSPLQKVALPRVQVPAKERVPVQPKPQPSNFVPPGYGKPQTRSRNLRRRRKRMHERDAAAGASGDGPVSGANGVMPGEDAREQADDAPTFMSLSLRNKNKAKNFKSLMNRPLPPKIIFGDVATNSADSTKTPTPALPRLTPPSMRSSLPPNLFVTSVDVEVDKRKMRVEYGDELVGVDVDGIEGMANERWATLPKPTREIGQGALVGYKALGIDMVTFTPGLVLTVGRVEACDVAVLVVRPLRAVSFNWRDQPEAEEHPWEEIESGDWRVL